MTSSSNDNPNLLSRRDVIRRVSAWLSAATFVGGSGLLAAAEKVSNAEGSSGEFTLEHIAFLDEIAETILPATKTPGAKAAKTGAFMALMVTDAYSAEEQKTFRDGMRKVEAAMQAANHVSFMAATPALRLAVLTALDHEQKRVMDAREAANFGVARKEGKLPAHYFRMMKELAMLGFFTSEVGCTHVLRYIESPGRFDPCLPYASGEPAWALHA
jgi:Gluconate 2-dehydrogenase subunit 3